MLRVFVDSGSSIKQEEKEKYNVEIIPLRYLMGDKEYRDGIDLSMDEFYNLLIGEKLFPKTSLPNLEDVKNNVTKYTDQGDEVIILTFSSRLSGTHDAIKNLFSDNKNVYVIDSLNTVGGIRILVEEINKYRDRPINEIIDKVNALVPRITCMAIPETLDYLLKGGRLSKKEWLLGSILHIKPVISIVNGYVKVFSKKIGLKNAMKYIVSELHRRVDENYSIVPSYTYSTKNLEELIDMTDEKYHKLMTDYDNLDAVVACHWGPNAFGYFYVGKEEFKIK